MSLFFSSDTHFNHANILNYCPWRKTWARDVDEMNSVLIGAWNETVKDTDVVYHLGDFSFGTESQLKLLRGALKGKIRLVLGNHDSTRAKMARCGFNVVEHHFKIVVDTNVICMTHDPIRFTKEEIEQATMLLHGHCHGMKRASFPTVPMNKCLDQATIDLCDSKLLDVGVDAVRRTRPVSLDEIIELFRERLACPKSPTTPHSP